MSLVLIYFFLVKPFSYLGAGIYSAPLQWKVDLKRWISNLTQLGNGTLWTAVTNVDSRLIIFCLLQVYLRKNPGSLVEGTLLAIGGRYDYLLHKMGDIELVCGIYLCFHFEMVSNI